MRKALLLIVVVALMLAAIPALAQEASVDWQQKYLELDVQYQQALVDYAELASRFTAAQRNVVIYQDGIASFSQRELTAVQNRGKDRRGPLAQSRRALQDYMKSLEPKIVDHDG